MALSVLAPITITDAMFNSSTVAETDYTAYSAATTYEAGDFCISTSTHRIYQSLVAGNINHDPTNILNRTANVAGITYWQDYAPTNKWAMFDAIVSTKTVTASPYTVVLTPGNFNSVYFGGLEADTINITVKDAPGGNVLTSTGDITLEGSFPPDYYEYFFNRFKPLTSYLLQGVAAYNAMEITVTFTRVTGNVSVGIMALGDLISLGMTMNGAKAKPRTFSYIDIDKFGQLTVVRRKATTDMTLSARLDTEEADAVLQVVQSVLDVPCVWVATECPQYSGLTVFGLGSAELNYANSTKSQLDLTVQGLI